MKEKLLRISLPCYFSFEFLEKRSGFQPEQKRVKAAVLGLESFDTEIKEAFEGKYKVGVFTKSVRCQVGRVCRIMLERYYAFGRHP